jgi:long-chain acyl-CoA synthetase
MSSSTGKIDGTFRHRVEGDGAYGRTETRGPGVREFSVPAIAEVGPDEALTDLLATNVAEHGDEVGLRRRRDGQWRDVTWKEFGEEVAAAAKGLIASGVEAGDRVALQAKTRYEWTVLDFAIWTAGGVVVPIYDSSSADQVAWILSDSGATALIVETDEHATAVESVRDQVPDLRSVFVIDRDAIDELTRAGQDVPDTELEARRATLKADTLATLIYTSGTTGRPKGCELTHSNFLFEIENGMTLLGRFLNVDGSILLFIPLAHVLARVIEVGSVKTRTIIGHTPDVKNLLDDLAEFKPTFVLAVPRVFEKVYNSAKSKAEGDGKGKIFDKAAQVAIDWSRAQDTGGPGILLKAEHAVFDKLVYTKLRAALGGRCMGAISGGAPLGDRLGHFFRGIGVTVYEGYGLTETTAAAAVNHDDALRIGTVGRPLPGVDAKVADDGELLLRGGIVMPGYWKNEKATAEALDSEGWVHTGDLGEIDDDGFLKITGRKKEILVTAGGKNVAPAVLEDRMRMHALISQCMVVGDGRPFVGVLVTIDPEAFGLWKERLGKPASATVADLRDDPDLNGEVQAAVDDANQAVSRAESIRKFRILDGDFTQEQGQLSAKLGIKRAVLAKEFAHEIEALYS